MKSIASAYAAIGLGVPADRDAAVYAYYGNGFSVFSHNTCAAAGPQARRAEAGSG